MQERLEVGSYVFIKRIAKCTYGRIFGEEESSTSDIRYRAELFTSCTKTIYGILQENIPVSSIISFRLTV